MRTNPPSEKFIKRSLYLCGVISHPSAGCWRIRSRPCCMKLRAHSILLRLIIQNWSPTFTFNPWGDSVEETLFFPLFMLAWPFLTVSSVLHAWLSKFAPIFYTELFWCCIINVVGGGSEDEELPAGLMSRGARCHFSVTADSTTAGESVKMDLEHQTSSRARTCALVHPELHASLL